MHARTADHAALAEVYVTAFKTLPLEVQREIWLLLRRDFALDSRLGELALKQDAETNAGTRYDETMRPEVKASLERSIVDHAEIWTELAKR
ncbi:MAG: hypothetical protein M1546_27465 [Chloroflexi bacterium]|nr:hypothetical protein [Chloroflexota bacterium]